MVVTVRGAVKDNKRGSCRRRSNKSQTEIGREVYVGKGWSRS